MHTNQYLDFNLIDDPWIPTSLGLRSIRAAFRDKEPIRLEGRFIEKFSSLNVLLAIAHAANDGQKPTRDHIDGYLDKWRDRFFLGGENPFMQLKQPLDAEGNTLSYDALCRDAGSGNKTLLSFRSASLGPDSSASLALAMITDASFALAGKTCGKKVAGKLKSSKAGRHCSYLGLLHSYLEGDTIWETVLMNMLTLKEISIILHLDRVLGRPVWEWDELTRDNEEYSRTYQSYLMPMCRFYILGEDSFYYADGYTHQNHKTGVDPLSVPFIKAGEKSKVKWCHSDKSPLRELPALLSFLDTTSNSQWHTYRLEKCLTRVHKDVTLVIGGSSVKLGAGGDNFVSGDSDNVESRIRLPFGVLQSDPMQLFNSEMSRLEEYSKNLWSAVKQYHSEFKLGSAEDKASKATTDLWLEWTPIIQGFLTHSGCKDAEKREILLDDLRRRSVAYLFDVYDRHCPHGTQRHIEAWALQRRFLTRSTATTTKAPLGDGSKSTTTKAPLSGMVQPQLELAL